MNFDLPQSVYIFLFCNGTGWGGTVDYALRGVEMEVKMMIKCMD